jgi:hypothetical protein
MAKQYPELDMLYAIPNGGLRNVIVAKKLKAEGVKRGVPDICLPVARHGLHGLYIELKTENGVVSDDQSNWYAMLSEQGYRARICRGAEQSIAAIKFYLCIP